MARDGWDGGGNREFAMIVIILYYLVFLPLNTLKVTFWLWHFASGCQVILSQGISTM